MGSGWAPCWREATSPTPSYVNPLASAGQEGYGGLSQAKSVVIHNAIIRESSEHVSLIKHMPTEIGSSAVVRKQDGGVG